MDNNCPYCELRLVKPRGPNISPILVIGEFPGYKETMEGRPFVGEAGEVLQEEFGRLGMDLNSVLITNMWLHEENKDKDCRDYSFKACIEEAIGRKAIFLVGSDCAKYFTGKLVMSVSGLFVESPLLNAKIIICAPNPAICLQKGATVGEFRLALKRFYKTCVKEGIYE